MTACQSFRFLVTAEDLKIQPPADVTIGLLVGTVIQQGANLRQRLQGWLQPLLPYLLHAHTPPKTLRTIFDPTTNQLHSFPGEGTFPPWP